jgi:hypothetical protein
MERVIDDRLAAALADLHRRSPTRRAKAFYLNESDWAAFTATERPTIGTMFGNNPPRKVNDPVFEGVPVRASRSAKSRLYDHTASGREI